MWDALPYDALPDVDFFSVAAATEMGEQASERSS